MKSFNVGYFTRKISHYRRGFLEKLKDNPRFSIKIFVSSSELEKDDAKNGFYSYEEQVIRFAGQEFYFQKNIDWIINKNKLDLVVFSFSPYNINLFLLPLLRRHRNYKIVAFTHGYFKNNKYESGKNKLLNYFLKKADGILFYTETIASMFLRVNRYEKGKVFWIDNTLDTKKITSLQSKIKTEVLRSLEEEYNLSNRKIVLFSGSINRSKRLEILLKAFSFIKNNCLMPMPFLFIIGDGEEKEHLEKYCEGRIEDHVAWLGQINDEERIAPYFMLSNLFVMPGKTGLSINHAFAYGVPYITTSDHIHAPEIELLKEGKNGELFNSTDHEDLAKRIVSLLCNDALLERYSQNAKIIIKTRYNIDNMENRFLKMVKYYAETSSRIG